MILIMNNNDNDYHNDNDNNSDIDSDNDNGNGNDNDNDSDNDNDNDNNNDNDKKKNDYDKDNSNDGDGDDDDNDNDNNNNANNDDDDDDDNYHNHYNDSHNDDKPLRQSIYLIALTSSLLLMSSQPVFYLSINTYLLFIAAYVVLFPRASFFHKYVVDAGWWKLGSTSRQRKAGVGMTSWWTYIKIPLINFQSDVHYH